MMRESATIGTKTEVFSTEFLLQTLFKEIILNSCSTGDKRSMLYLTVYCLKSEVSFNELEDEFMQLILHKRMMLF